ncbi:MAG: GGDEF domain-containing protein [Spirochaetia bacterium]|nr:GGDEF domain-containing protein [Spirochaetia bacterium]
MHIQPIEIQKKMLFYIHPCMLVALLISLLAVLNLSAVGQQERTEYVFLISILLVLVLGAGILLKLNFYLISVILTILIPLIGTWYSIYINLLEGVYELIPLCYGVIPIMLASIFLPTFAAAVLMILQLVAFGFILVTMPVFHTQNWASFSIFILFVCTLSIVANTLINNQLQQLKKLAIQDYLTGLFNRRYFEETLSIKLMRIQPERRNLGLILIDIDHFKEINDSYGHDAGDAVLTSVANLLIDHFDLSCTVCRYGGDEFTVLIPQISPPKLASTAQALVERVHSLSVMYKGKSIDNISISAGYVLSTEQCCTTPKTLLESADIALYNAKKAGKDRAMGRTESNQGP